MTTEVSPAEFPIGIVGSGVMGRGIAQIASAAGFPVRVFDAEAKAIAEACDFVGKMLARAAELGLEDVVRIRGWLGRDQIDGFFRGIDAMLVPDPDIEFNHYCAMNKVTHAMARAIPVVLRPLRENARLVTGAGFVADDMGLPAFTAAIERFLDAPAAEREAQGARLRKTFEAELAWAASSARYVAAYRSEL